MSQVEQPVIERIAILRRRFATSRRHLRGPAEVVPLVNIALLILLFIVFGQRFVLQPGVTVNLPTSSFAEGAPYGALVVTVTQEGLLFFNDDLVAPDGLELALAQAVSDQPDARLVIQADGRVQHSTLVQVYNAALAAGVQSVVLATRVPSRSVDAP